MNSRKYKANLETVELLKTLCDLGLGYLVDLAIVDLSVKTGFIFNGDEEEGMICSVGYHEMMIKKGSQSEP